MKKDGVKKAWEERAIFFKDQKEAVMQQSFPRVVNDHIHRLHVKEVFRFLPKEKCKILDIGCGYGRITPDLIRRNRKAFVYGVDISSNFIKMYNKKFKGKGRGVVADIKNLPFSNNTFDYVICIVTFMYCDTLKDQKKAMSEILRVAKPQAKIILIEPNSSGTNIIKLFGLIPFLLRDVLRRKKVETFGISFPFGRIDSLVEKKQGALIEKRGYPFLTIMLLPILVIAKISKTFARIVLQMTSVLDKIFPFPNFSHVITYIIIKS